MNLEPWRIIVGSLLLGVAIYVCILQYIVKPSREKDFQKPKAQGTIKLPCDQKLFYATWRDDEVWYATRGMNSSYEKPDTYTFVGGGWGEKVIIIESRCEP